MCGRPSPNKTVWQPTRREVPGNNKTVMALALPARTQRAPPSLGTLAHQLGQVSRNIELQRLENTSFALQSHPERLCARVAGWKDAWWRKTLRGVL